MTAYSSEVKNQIHQLDKVTPWNSILAYQGAPAPL
jgi:hypothetical protein